MRYIHRAINTLIVEVGLLLFTFYNTFFAATFTSIFLHQFVSDTATLPDHHFTLKNGFVAVLSKIFQTDEDSVNGLE